MSVHKMRVERLQFVHFYDTNVTLCSACRCLGLEFFSEALIYYFLASSLFYSREFGSLG